MVIFSSNLIIDNPSVQNVMSPVSSALLVIKDDVGNIYWPMLGINQIGNFELGSAYMSKMTFDIDLQVYGSNIDSPESQGDTESNNSLQNTSNSVADNTEIQDENIKL